MKKHILGDYGMQKVVDLIKVAEYELEGLYGKVNHNSREFNAVARRAAYCHMLVKHKEYYSLSMALIGACIAKALHMKKGYDHATVMHNSRTACNLLDTSRDFGHIYRVVKRVFTEDMLQGHAETTEEQTA
jgi:hypothetical protein